MFSIRRGASFLAMLGVLSASVEIAVPEVHEGDVATETAAWIQTSQPSDDAPPHAPAGDSGLNHTAHLDHCAHSHLLDAGRKVCYTAVASNPRIPFLLHAVRPASISLTPDQRPPIV